jgi:hypothetical protein
VLLLLLLLLAPGYNKDNYHREGYYKDGYDSYGEALKRGLLHCTVLCTVF